MKIYKLSAFLVFLTFSISISAQKMKPEDVVAKHLDSIGSASVRTGVKSQIAVGEVSVKSVVQKDVKTEGRIVLASQGERNFLGMSLNTANYPAEKFGFDGKKATVAFVRNGVRSSLGSFISTNDALLKESLFGGILSTSWVLSNVAAQKPKISFDGTKKINNRETYVLGYSPKGGSDVAIKMYFDQENFRHVRTEYKRVSSAGIGLRPDQSSRFSESRISLTEDFSDFRDVKGLMLPHDYRIFYSILGQNGTTEIEWAIKLSEFSINPNLAPNTFDINEAGN